MSLEKINIGSEERAFLFINKLSSLLENHLISQGYIKGKTFIIAYNKSNFPIFWISKKKEEIDIDSISWKRDCDLVNFRYSESTLEIIFDNNLEGEYISNII